LKLEKADLWLEVEVAVPVAAVAVLEGAVKVI
jgi:hypothetical protein